MITEQKKSVERASLKGKKVLLTGGTTGIGRATAIRLLEEGAELFIFGRHQPELDDALKLMEPLGMVHGMTADQSEDEDVRRVFDEADEKLGGIDILINNAAIGADGADTEDLESIRYCIESNLIGLIQCSHLALKKFKGRGQIINIGSMSNVGREKGSSVYVATKSGVNGFSEAFRKEANAQNVRVVLIEPGLVGTDMTAQPPAEQRKMIKKGEMLVAEDIAEAVIFAATQPERTDVVLIQIRPHKQSDI